MEDDSLTKVSATTHEGAEPDWNSDTFKNVEEENAIINESPSAGAKKKKKKPKSAMANTIRKGTGFEEFFADVPITAAQAREDLELYSSHICVDDRIQTAIQRFCTRRKFDSALKGVFDRYLDFGGIDTGPNVFGGVGDHDSDDLKSHEVASLKAGKFLNEAVLEGSMVVDFDGVLKAFLSSYSSMWFTQEPKSEIRRRVNVIRNFLNYLLYHSVCPAYEDQIKDAKGTCDIGEAQLWLVGECGRNMPGNFNIACSLLFHGWYHNCYLSSQAGSSGPDAIRQRVQDAQMTFRAAIACHGSEKMCTKYMEDNRAQTEQPLRKFHTGLEVTRIQFANDEKRSVYKMPMFTNCKCTGQLFARTWHNPASLDHDLTDEEEDAGITGLEEIEIYEFWVEDDILSKVFQGMKFETDVYELTCGVFFFDQPVNFRCSFFSWIPNEAMIGWREHVYIPPKETRNFNEPEAAE